MAKIRFREKKFFLWRRLVKILNSKKIHRKKDVEEACSFYFMSDVKEGTLESNMSRSYGAYMLKLKRYGFLEEKTVINQNGIKIEKIIMKRKISKKITPDLFDKFKEQPWMAWFMFPG